MYTYYTVVSRNEVCMNWSNHKNVHIVAISRDTTDHCLSQKTDRSIDNNNIWTTYTAASYIAGMIAGLGVSQFRSN